jgi:homoserine dehydrogenase
MRTIYIVQLGLGGVGRALVRQIVRLRRWHREKYDLHLEYVALCDSDGAIVDTDGIPDKVLLDAVEWKKRGRRLKEHPEGYGQGDAAAIVDVAGTEGTAVVDVTASEAVLPALLLATRMGYGVVLANKKPLTGSMEVYRSLKSGTFFRYESTVGSGLPVIATLRRLLESGDRPYRIEGALSGTLGYLMGRLQEGVPFSRAVRTAYDLGYTEPDPRDDLGGVDVARKALILARDLGYESNMEEIALTPLYPEEMDALSVSRFLDAVSALDEGFAARARKAAEGGKVLRFAASVAEGEIRVGLQEVPQDSPLGRLVGSDNLVAYHTGHYDELPMVLQGRGAGVEATAAGVLADLVEFVV